MSTAPTQESSQTTSAKNSGLASVYVKNLCYKDVIGAGEAHGGSGVSDSVGMDVMVC
jgi:hypothetical protein